MAEEESGFSVVDKRRVSQEESTTGETSSSAAQEDAEPSPESGGHLPHSLGELPHLTVRDRLLMSIDILHQGAWLAMGLVADPSTGEIERNLDDAKIAIDAVAYLASQVEPSLDEPTRREVKRVLSDLQVNFVRQKQL